jgi:hypothetical protein
VRDELWSAGRLVERRLSHGVARRSGSRILASDAFDAELARACDEELHALRDDVDDEARVRLLASARRVSGVVLREATMTITIDGVSVVSRDAAALRALLERGQRTAVEAPAAALVWRNGSAAVLLHEAIGHAAEHDVAPVRWPSWLTVHDEPPFAVDDEGNESRVVDLMAVGPSCLRRESFRDVPLRRMTNVVARQHAAPFEVPESFVEIELVAGGSYDPVSDLVTVDVAVSSAGAFTLRRTRAQIASSLAGATGEPLRYPGVICSREGQELAVGSFAPVMVTR